MSVTPVPGRSELLAAIEDWHAGTMTESAAHHFKERLRADVHACQVFIEYGDMLSQLSLEAANATDEQVDDRIAGALRSSRSSSSAARLVRQSLVMAVCLCIFVVPAAYFGGLGDWFGGPDTRPQFVVTPPNVISRPAIVAFVTDVYSRAGQAKSASPLLQVGAELTASELLVIESEFQFVELQFASSAHLIVQGPARLHLESANSARLESGRVLGMVPPAAVGFLLRVPSGEIRDLGTEFAVDAQQATTDIAVLRGSVDCELQTPGQEVVRTKVLAEEQVRMDAQTASLAHLTAPPQSLGQIVEFHSGVADVGGEAQYQPQLPPLPSEAGLFSSALAQIYPERLNVPVQWNPANKQIQFLPDEHHIDVKNATAVSVKPDVIAESIRQMMSGPLATDCYFLRLKAPTKQSILISGSVTFRQEIVAVLTSTDSLTLTDSSLARPEFAAEWRDHPNKSRGSNESADIVKIGPDGKTLSFTLQASGANDELRVLVRHRVEKE